jgi:hypothetical protein
MAQKGGRVPYVPFRIYESDQRGLRVVSATRGLEQPYPLKLCNKLRHIRLECCLINEEILVDVEN